ncbi:MAG: leucyl aminopeptidase family protein [Rhodobacteraceae bacterium]|nr:leucyl aminopeptidase family protein [Paracoccaceae bacterium]
MANRFASSAQSAIPVHAVEADGDYPAGITSAQRDWLKATGFSGGLGEVALLPDNGTIGAVLVGWGTEATRVRGRFHLAAAAQKLPEGVYRIASGIPDEDLENEALGWLMSNYRFSKYRDAGAVKAVLSAPDGIDAKRVEVMAEGDALARDLINTPASDMGPDALEAAFCALGEAHGAEVSVIKGEALLEENLPLIHAVGRASDQAPRLLDLRWGILGAPTVTLVGKGVCFDTGGLNIKPGASMGLMKKDMGGSANVMALAHMVMALKLPVRLRVLVPAVENSISAGAFRPGDILSSRKGPTIEVNNTDAEGRLVLADALAVADEETPDMLLCLATLTGAARVALGPDLPPFYTDGESLAADISEAADASADPLWRMPFWNPYEGSIEPGIADLDNAPAGGMAGSITAALFLRRFVENTTGFAHFDIYGWTPVAKPARSKGGACQSARALLAVIEKRVK